MQLSLAVKSDREVDAADLENANLILFGKRETNAVIARIAAQLPLALEPARPIGASRSSVPVGGRYVVVNSGLPWWTGAAGQAPFRVLERFGDFMVFKGSLDNVVAEGVFDRQWRVPAGVAEKLRAAGTVEVK